MKVTIEKKAFELKFGFKCLKQLGKNLGLNSYNEVLKKLAILDNLTDDVTFEQDDLIQELMIAAVESHENYAANPETIESVDIMQWVVTNPEPFSEVIKALIDSMPQNTGKKPPVKKSRQKKKP